MIRKISLFLALAAALPGTASAWVGGPFDNNSYGQLLERNGVYQATFTFKNGSGFAYFTTDNALVPETSSEATLTSATISSSLFGTSNRSVVYYKGLTFIGSATGNSDLTARQINGYTNGFSEISVSQDSTGGGTGGGISSTSVVVSNTGGANYTANTQFRAKITDTSPQLRFKGTGEVSIISPDNFATISETLAEFLQDSYEIPQVTDDLTSAVIDNIFPDRGPTALPMPVAEVEPRVQAAINAIMAISQGTSAIAAETTQRAFNDFREALTPPTADEAAAKAERFKMNVFGYMKLF